MSEIEALERARSHIVAALDLADQARDALLGARLCQCLESVDQQLGALALLASVLAGAGAS